MATKTRQTTFKTPEQKVRDVFERASREDFGPVLAGVSGGTDSVLSAWLAAVYGPEYGIELDAIVHANTGLAVPQTRLAAQVLAMLTGTPFIEANNGTTGPRVLKHGWPMVGKKGHFFERIERKEDVFDAIHAAFSEDQLWISGARSTESDERKMNVPDSGVEWDGRRGRQLWASPCVGLTSEEKWDWIAETGLPVPETYLSLGFSGECVACVYDDAGILTELDYLAPNLAWAIRNLTAWLPAFHAMEDTETDLTPKQLCWGWDPDADDTPDEHPQQDLDGNRAEPNSAWTGCSAESCEDRDIPDAVFDLPDWQLIGRDDVLRYVDGDGDVSELTERFNEVPT